MSLEIMSVAKAGFSLLGSFGAMQAARASYDAARQQSMFEIAEAARQQEENDRIADEKAEMRMRQADAAMGTLVAAMSDGGGAGTTNAAAFAGEIGYLEGFDLTSNEKNRVATFRALEAKKNASYYRAINIITSAGTTAQTTIWNNLAKATDSIFDGIGDTPETQTPSPQPSPATHRLVDLWPTR